MKNEKENVKEKIIRFLKSDNPQEIAANIPWKLVSFLLAVPAGIFIIAIAVELFKSLLIHSTYPADTLDISFLHNAYHADIVWINCEAAIIGLAALAAYFFKLRYGGGRASSVLKNPTVICFGALIVFMLLSTLRNGCNGLVLSGDLYRREALGSFIIYPVIYYFATSLIGSETAKRRLINGFLAASFLVAAMSLLHVVAAEHGFARLAAFTESLVSGGVVGIYHQINHYGYSLVIAITLSGAMFVSAEKRSLQIIYLAGFVLFNTVLILNDSFGAYLAVFVSLLFLIVLYLIKDKKTNPRTFVLLGVFVLVSLTVDFKGVWTNISTLFSDLMRVFGNIQGSVSSSVADVAGTTRWRLWKSTLKMISERPLLGYGVEGIGQRLTAEAGSDRPHNEFLQYAAFFGIPALMCYVGAVASVFLSFLRRRTEASPCTVVALVAAFGYLVSSCFGNTMYYTAPLFFIVLGMADTRPSKYL